MTPNPAIADLPDTLEYSGEFGAELIGFVPFAHWLKVNGHLAQRRVLTYSGMRPFYYFLDDSQYAEKTAPRHVVEFGHRPAYWPSPSPFRSTEKKSSELYPNYREAFGGRFAHRFDKPLLAIHNKFCNEWSQGPINFMTLETLDRMFERLKGKFQIVYFREGFGSFKLNNLGFSSDRNHPLEFGDGPLLEEHPEVVSFERTAAMERDRFSYNELKLMVFADCHNFISSQGGGSWLTTLMSGATTVILHRAGAELRMGTYARGFFRYLADENSRLLIARTSAELEDAAGIFLADGEGAHASAPDAGRLWERYSSDRAFDPDHHERTPSVW